MKKKGVSYEAFRQMISAFPTVEEAIAYGTPIFRVGKTLLARLLENNETIVLKMNFPLRSSLLDGAPDTFHITPHYENYPVVLIKLANISQKDLSYLTEQAWRLIAAKRVVEAFDKNKKEI